MSLLRRRRALQPVPKPREQSSPPPTSPRAPTPAPGPEAVPEAFREHSEVFPEEPPTAPGEGASLPVDAFREHSEVFPEEPPTAPAAPQALPASVDGASVEGVLSSFASGLTSKSAKAYRKDLEHFAAWKHASLVHALTTLLQLSGKEGVAEVSAWDVHMLAAGVSVATVRRRLSALRSFIKAAGLRGLTTWTLEIDGPPRNSHFSGSSLRYGGMLMATGYALRTYAVEELMVLFGPGEIECPVFTIEP